MITKKSLRDVNWRIFVAYDGSDYCGWQKQKGCLSVSEAIEKALSKFSKDKIEIFVAGRTDAGVHALGQVFSCRFSSRLSSRNIILACAQNINKNISIWRADEVPYSFNARHHAIGKQYIYKIETNLPLSPFQLNQNWHLRQKLNIDNMIKAAKCFIGENDFESFRSSHCDSPHARRYIWHLDIQKDQSKIIFDIRGNAFCRNMVRIIVGTLVDVGLGKIKPGSIKEVLLAKNRLKAGRTAPASGLYLAKVYYPDDLDNAGIPNNAKFPRYPINKNTWPFNNEDFIYSVDK